MPARGDEAAQTERTRTEGTGAQPTPPGGDRGTNPVRPQPKSPPKSHRDRPGESARQPGQGRPTPRGPGEGSTSSLSHSLSPGTGRPRPHPAAAALAAQGEAAGRRVPPGRQQRWARRGPLRTCPRLLPAAPAVRPPPSAPRPFRRRTKAPTAGWRLPTADAEGQTSSEGVAGRATVYRNCGKTRRSVQ